jgi:hypothetical protein
MDDIDYGAQKISSVDKALSIIEELQNNGRGVVPFRLHLQ